MDDQELMQKKISDTIQILQEQRNSALDVVVTKTVELKAMVSRLEQANLDFNKLTNSFDKLLADSKDLVINSEANLFRANALEKANHELNANIALLRGNVDVRSKVKIK